VGAESGSAESGKRAGGTCGGRGPAEEAPDFQNGLDTVFWDFQLVGSIKHAAVFQERDHPARGAYFQVGRLPRHPD